MAKDPAGAFRRIAAHTGITYPRALEEWLIKAASFSNMKANAARFAVAAGTGFWPKDADFFESATSNKWLGKLTEKDFTAYEARISALLNPQDRKWLERGSTPN